MLPILFMHNTVMFAVAVVLLTCASVSGAWRVPLPPSILHPPRSTHARSSARSRAAQAAWRTGAPPPGRVYSPVDFGGDPTGVTDATVAVSAAISALLASAGPEHDSQGVRDCGGATLDLRGGEFLISEPLIIPTGYGNLRLAQGTLRASPSFPRDRYVVEVGKVNGTSGVVDVDINEFFCDAWQVATGCILTNGVQGGVIGPQVYAFNFTQFGIRANAGFELTIMQTWVAEYWWSDPRKENGTASTAVGIWKNGNDGAIVDVIVFSARVGVQVSGGANILDSIHTWSLANGRGGIGILVDTAQARLRSCYLDWQDVVFAQPTMVSFTGGFFLCGARMRFIGGGKADNVYLADNELIADYCGFSGYDAVEVDGSNWTSVADFTVVATHAQPMIGVRNTAVTLAVTSAVPTTTYSANFTAHLLFDVAAVPIRAVTYSVQLADASVPVMSHAALPALGGLVTIELATPAAATVVISVDQSLRRSGAA